MADDEAILKVAEIALVWLNSLFGEQVASACGGWLAMTKQPNSKKTTWSTRDNIPLFVLRIEGV